MTAKAKRYDTLKRATDAVVAAAALVVLAPVLATTWVLVRHYLGKPALFRQKRPGLNGEIFEIVKFRTMTDATDIGGALLPDEQRLTPFGKFLRASSLDELPQLWTVLKGDMSLVGPRPLLTKYLPLYSPSQARRHEVRPGLTGWAQINGRNDIEWDKRLDMDVWYVDNRSVVVDVRILVASAGIVLLRRGISKSGEATMPEFRGSQPPQD